MGDENLTERDFVADMEATRQSVYKWAQLPQSKGAFGRDIRKLQAAGITSYEAAYQLVQNESADPKLRLKILDTLFQMLVYARMWGRVELIDKQAILPALMVALDDRNAKIRDGARQLVEYLELRECVPHLLHMLATDKSRYNRIFAMSTLAGWQDPDAMAALLAIVTDRSKSDFFRTHAIFCLWQYPVNSVIQNLLENVMIEPTESVAVREEAAEALADMGRAETVDAYLALLAESDPMLRLRGVFGLGAISSKADIAAAIPFIDHLASTDNAVPSGWWSVASMAMRALELFWYQRLTSQTAREGYLISPLLEYYEFQAASFVFGDGDDAEFVPIQQTTTLSIDPAALAKHMLGHWPTAKINVRDPQPETLILDWVIKGQASPLVGGLHRNGYWVVVTGERSDIADFAAWLRIIVPPNYPLRLHYSDELTGETKTDIVGEIRLDEAGRLIRSQ